MARQPCRTRPRAERAAHAEQRAANRIPDSELLSSTARVANEPPDLCHSQNSTTVSTLK